MNVSRTVLQIYSDTKPNNSCGAYICDLLFHLAKGSMLIDKKGDIEHYKEGKKVKRFLMRIESIGSIFG